MMNHSNQRGSALVLALFGILLFMTMVVGFTYDARSRSAYNAGFKLNSYYYQTARSVLNAFVVETLPGEWEAPPRDNTPNYSEWRFGKLLQNGGLAGKYGYKIYSDQQTFQNLNNLDLSYNIWIANNQDDPAISYEGTDLFGETITQDWDMDSKIVVTVEVYDTNDPAKTPRATVTSMVGPSGNTTVLAYADITNTGDQTGDVGNQGRADIPAPKNLDDYRDTP